MCMLIVGTADDLLWAAMDKPRLLESIVAKNRDGVGAMYAAKDGAPWAAKAVGLYKADDVREWIAKTLPAGQGQAALHFRMATSGMLDLDNCHPFELDGGWFMHNGVLDVDADLTDTRSDTRIMLDHLKGNAKAYLGTEFGKELMGDYIGSTNKFAWLAPGGIMHIVNPMSGFMHGGLWFSNTYALDMTVLDPHWKPATPTYYGGVFSGHSHWKGIDDNEDAGLDLWDTFDGMDVSDLPYATPDELSAVMRSFGAATVLSSMMFYLGMPDLLDPIDVEDEDLALAICEGDTDAVAAAVESEGYAHVADVVLYCLDWSGRTPK